MRRALWVCALVLLLAACTALVPTTTDSGVEGSVFIGPMCPVVQEGQECPDQPYQADLIITTTNGRVILRFRTDEDGAFHVPLAPGDYVLHPEPGNGIAYAADQPFTVISGQFTELIVQYDSGIR